MVLPMVNYINPCSFPARRTTIWSSAKKAFVANAPKCPTGWSAECRRP